MKRNILFGSIGFFLGTSWIPIGWLTLTGLDMLSPPKIDDSFFKRIEEEKITKAVITYRKREVKTNEVVNIRFVVSDSEILDHLQYQLRTWKFRSCFRTVEFEPDVQFYTQEFSSPWKISFEGRTAELFLSRCGKYCVASVYGNSFYEEVLRLVEENERKLSTENFQIEI